MPAPETPRPSRRFHRAARAEEARMTSLVREMLRGPRQMTRLPEEMVPAAPVKLPGTMDEAPPEAI